MEKCLYNGKVLYAYQVLQNFEFEQEIRRCQSLTCCDCGSSVFFRHGKQRAECFAHRHKEECKYGEYCKKQSNIFKFIQRQLAPVMERIATKHGFQLEEDATVLQDHYTAFIIRSPFIKYAIDIIDYAVTSNTLEKRKNLYEEQGYLYLQITVDKYTEREPFSEREMAYFPVKFALNKSRNNTAIVIDEIRRDWSIYIFDKTDLSGGIYDRPSWLVNNTLAMSISLDDIDINNDGFYTTVSDKAFIDFCVSRKNEKEKWLKVENERQKRQRKYVEEVRKKTEYQCPRWEHKVQQKELQRRQAEEAKRKVQEEEKRQAELAAEIAKQQRKAEENAEIKRLHELSGGYVGSKVRGKYEVITLEQIAANRPSCDWLKKYTKQDFENCISEMQQFKSSGVSMIFAKMCFITPDETAILLNLYNILKTSDYQTANAIEFLMRKAGINF